MCCVSRKLLIYHLFLSLTCELCVGEGHPLFDSSRVVVSVKITHLGDCLAIFCHFVDPLIAIHFMVPSIIDRTGTYQEKESMPSFPSFSFFPCCFLFCSILNLFFSVSFGVCGICVAQDVLYFAMWPKAIVLLVLSRKKVVDPLTNFWRLCHDERNEGNDISQQLEMGLGLIISIGMKLLFVNAQ